MLKIVIADDEKMIREGLEKTIPWSRFDSEVVGLAKDGDEALQLCRLWHPNILITDIRMPKMTGIDLLKTLDEEMPFINVIILSGYDDFEYAKAALRYGAKDYLVKPINAEEVIRVVDEVTSGVEQHLKQDSKMFEHYRGMTTALKQYYNALFSGDYEASKRYLLTAVNELVMKKMPVDQFQRLCLQLVTTVLNQLKNEGCSLDKGFEEKYQRTYQPIAKLTQMRTLIEFINTFNNDVIECLSHQEAEPSHHVIADVVHYIDDHYMDNIGLEDVATLVRLNKDYLSHIFKQSVGEGFSDYMNRKRVDKAKELLVHSNAKVYEISDEVGYQDYKYFGMVFKKFEGVSPTKYRKSHIFR